MNIQSLDGFLKTPNQNYSGLHKCNNAAQFREVFQVAHNLSEHNSLKSSFNPPCNEMRAVVNIKKGKTLQVFESVKNVTGQMKLGPNDLRLSFVYMAQEYQEIKNEKDFDMEMLWSSIGGIVGIFVGYSLLQLITDGLNSAGIFITSTCNRYCHRKHLTAI